MKPTLDRFYPIVDGAARIARLLSLGARLVQLRIKDRGDAELTCEIRAAKAICAAHGAQLVVNDHWKQALDEGCDFIHLGQEDLDHADIPTLRRAGARLGISTHDHAELDRALSFMPDYIALGPIYPTTLKVMPWAPQGLDRIAEWKRRIGGIPLCAIGGLTVERLPGVFAAGADIAAVVGDIVTAPDPDERISTWIAATRGN